MVYHSMVYGTISSDSFKIQIKTIDIICDTELGGTLVILYMLLNYPSQNPSQLVMLPEVLGV